ncbi:hypothetical protein PVT67_06970 [Gallaecimonas kandeliae]|uniref:hypothetical protein n=1 Tax=Gallaecimonas kandeliae TaxID=3029055 RepID=UPI002647EF51|nr:hypothetical protein [Gallaecimonas kandeliae]WKE66971.1 hypothetical protein PVT67_06970 [Gallaecimonas kandeliae]
MEMEIEHYSAMFLIAVLLFIAITDLRFKQRQAWFVSMVGIVPAGVSIIERLTDLWVAIAALVVVILFIVFTRKKNVSTV